MSEQDWNAQGMSAADSQAFAQDMYQLWSMRVFSRILPKWSDRHQIAVRLTVETEPGLGGVGITLQFSSPHVPPVALQDLITMLKDMNVIMELENAIQAMKETGCPVDLINPVVDKVNQSAEEYRVRFLDTP